MLLGGAARNRMLVHGASSFNGLVRALKQDLVEGKAPHKALRNPQIMYQVDKVRPLSRCTHQNADFLAYHCATKMIEFCSFLGRLLGLLLRK